MFVRFVMNLTDILMNNLYNLSERSLKNFYINYSLCIWARIAATSVYLYLEVVKNEVLRDGTR
jgi:hypothetical protein